MALCRSKYGDLFNTHIFACPTVISINLEVNRFVQLNEVSRGACSWLSQMDKWNITAVHHNLHRRMR
ncbi:hypothetical protein SUGI_0230790 [Cryptomeria japonica]|nr:hypothetical protein SUGI_0230790 [Cryptomeria japonica]